MPKQPNKPTLNDKFHDLLKDLEPVREYKFDPDRLWKLDFAWPDYRVAVEVQGATFTGGRHARGSGMQKDYEKYNTAQAGMGWIVIFCTAKDLNVPGDVLGWVQSACYHQTLRSK